MIFNGPNPDKAEISNLFDEFLTCSQPLTDSISGWSPQSPESSSSISPSLSPEASPPPEPFPFITGIHSRISIPQPFKPTVPKRKIVQTEQPLKRTAAKKAKKEPAVPLVPPEGASEADIDMCKKARRRKQNRDAAQTSREKKKRYLQGLEQQVCDLKKENQRLMELLEASQRENRVLKGEPADPPAAAGGSMFLPPLDPSAATPTLQEAKPEQPIVKKETPVATEKAKMNITVKTEPSTTFESAAGSGPLLGHAFSHPPPSPIGPGVDGQTCFDGNAIKSPVFTPVQTGTPCFPLSFAPSPAIDLSDEQLYLPSVSVASYEAAFC